VTIVPELTEALLEQVGGVEPLVGGEQQPKRALAFKTEVLTARPQGVLVACGAAATVALWNGFHMSITAKRMLWLLFGPSRA
jgi:hypothetical protein